MLFWRGRAIVKVSIMGIVVQLVTRATHTVCRVNDPTGAIDCIIWKDAIIAPPCLGDLVLVRGKVSTHGQIIRINVAELHLVQNPNEEIVWNLEILALKKHVYLF